MGVNASTVFFRLIGGPWFKKNNISLFCEIFRYFKHRARGKWNVSQTSMQNDENTRINVRVIFYIPTV